MSKTLRVGVVGARGYVGQELCALLLAHPHVDLVYAASKSADGRLLQELWPRLASSLQRADSALRFQSPNPGVVSSLNLDVVFLALPNETSAPFVSAVVDDNTIIIDLSADHRFDDTWTYGLPERNRIAIARSTRIANPGCYATALQLAVAPFVDVIAAPPRVFGVSGYSGAGTTPSEKNDAKVLEDNLLAYAPIAHVHEREASRHLKTPVHFMPHVASWFRGIHLTVDFEFQSALTTSDMRDRLQHAYEDEVLVDVTDAAPRVRDCVGTPRVFIGGAVASGSQKDSADDPGRGVVVATIDNLLKGAATQAIQNMNLAAGIEEMTAILPND